MPSVPSTVPWTTVLVSRSGKAGPVHSAVRVSVVVARATATAELSNVTTASCQPRNRALALSVSRYDGKGERMYYGAGGLLLLVLIIVLLIYLL